MMGIIIGTKVPQLSTSTPEIPRVEVTAGLLSMCVSTCGSMCKHMNPPVDTHMHPHSGEQAHLQSPGSRSESKLSSHVHVTSRCDGVDMILLRNITSTPSHPNIDIIILIILI